MAEQPRSAGCLCGAVRFSAAPKRLSFGACHCEMCRKWSGGVYMSVVAEDLVFEDQAALGVYRSSGIGERLFCTKCGSTLMWRAVDGGAFEVALPAFDDQSGFVFEEEIFIDDKPAFYAFANDTRKLTGAESMAEFVAQKEARSHG